MITAATSSSDLQKFLRLDAWYFLSPGATARRRLESAKESGVTTVTLGGGGGLGQVWMPSRLKQHHAATGEPARPYLRAHEVFDYLPHAKAFLSVARTKAIDDYLVQPGTILQTRSGRNLGPSTIADACFKGFAVSDDLARIWIEDERMRFYAYAFLTSVTGQGVLRRDKTGSVIDHLAVPQLEEQEIPLLESDVIDEVAAHVEAAFRLVEKARVTLLTAVEQYEASLPAITRSPAKKGWSVSSTALSDRLDAAPFDPLVAQIRKDLLAAGGVPVSKVARVVKPPGRYKTYYVTRSHGRPLLSGTQILQRVLVKPQFMAERAFDDPTVYEVTQGWSLYMADGRAEKGLGVVAMVTAERDGWLASGHVGRLVPLEETDPGWLWLAARTRHAQIQIKALSSGSVVDATFPSDMETVILPPVGSVDGPGVTAAWKDFADGLLQEQSARALIDARLVEVSGVEELAEEDDADGLDSPSGEELGDSEPFEQASGGDATR